MKILVVNAGSSSLKYQVLEPDTGTLFAKGICEAIGNTEASMITHQQVIKDIKIKDQHYPMENHAVALKLVVEKLLDKEVGCIESMDEIEAVGHRVVHGGAFFSESMLLTDEVLEKLKLCNDFAPLHTPAHIQGIQGCLAVMPDKPQVLVFDTAFHQSMAPEAYTYALPYELYEKYGVRRYGAHGTSHRFVAGEMCKILGRTEGTKIVTCHIGNGSSISAVKDGKVMDTSMGFTPLAGVEMGTRCGDIDPALVPYMMEKLNLSGAEVNNLMNKKSGFLGISGFSSDSRDLENAIANGPSDPHYERANLAVNILKFQLKKYIGAYSAIMNGLDAVVFTAGIGENNPHLREIVCEDMEYFGIKINKELNAKTLRQPNIVKLSTDDSKVAVYLIPTNEELVIARDTAAIVSAAK
ncbi:MAG: acetate kinase [Ruminococcaceae bacterium]|nr:acetate kinase [Oscillospiraceae bacterium]